MMNLKESKVRGEAQRAMIIEAAQAIHEHDWTGEPTSTPESIRTILVERLGWLTNEQYYAALELAQAEVLPLVHEEQQAQLEYEYQLENNI